MLSKTRFRATAVVLVLLAASCRSVVPWRDEPIGSETNLAFSLEQNLIHLQSVRVDNRPGRFILGTAAPRTVIDPTMARAGSVQLSEKRTVRVSPVALDLSGVADAIIGADAWGKNTITIDYRAGVVTFQKYAIEPDGMTLFHYRGEPAINVLVDGAQIAAIVDTTSPDTLVLPGTTKTRGSADVRVADLAFGTIDVQYADVARARIGNRLLSRFLVSIDYGRRVVGLWRDPRVAPST
jgi:hypothetical protein